MDMKQNAWNARAAKKPSSTAPSGLTWASVLVLVLALAVACVTAWNQSKDDGQREEWRRLLGMMPDVVERGGCEYCRGTD